MIFKDYPSKSSPGTNYRAQVNPDTKLVSCKCRGWINKREGMVRHCTHTDDLIEEFGLIIEVRDEQQFVVEQKPMISKERLARAQPVSRFIQPMKAISMPEGRDADGFPNISYLMEEKFDGHRIVMAVEDHRVYAWSGGEKPRTLPEQIERQASRLPDGYYDGELYVPGGHSYDVTAGMNAGTEVLVLFDVMKVLNEDVTGETYVRRREYLEAAMKAIPKRLATVLIAEQYSPSMAEVKKIWKRGGEGAIIKKRSGRYQPGYRSADWIKVKAVAAATLVIIGYEPGKVGAYSAVKIRDPKGIETTVKTLNNETMRAMQENPKSFIGRSLVISYHERTPSGKYRHPMWDHLL